LSYSVLKTSKIQAHLDAIVKLRFPIKLREITQWHNDYQKKTPLTSSY